MSERQTREVSMTARQRVRQDCANFLPDGRCMGVNIKDDLRQVMMKPEGCRCLVVKGEKCRYFEACVAPRS